MARDKHGLFPPLSTPTNQPTCVPIPELSQEARHQEDKADSRVGAPEVSLQNSLGHTVVKGIEKKKPNPTKVEKGISMEKPTHCVGFHPSDSGSMATVHGFPGLKEGLGECRSLRLVPFLNLVATRSLRSDCLDSSALGVLLGLQLANERSPLPLWH